MYVYVDVVKERLINKIIIFSDLLMMIFPRAVIILNSRILYAGYMVRTQRMHSNSIKTIFFLYILNGIN